MPRRWTKQEENERYNELKHLYVIKNLTISEVANILGIGEATVYDRLIRLGIKSSPERKNKFLNKRKINLPKYSKELAELVGILLGDGHLSKTQVFVHLGSKELQYAQYIRSLFKKIFRIKPKLSIRNTGHRDIYLGSVDIVKFFKDMGLVENKVKFQVRVPKWIFGKKEYGASFLRGFFDTDGSIYKLRHGWQISYCNKSLPLLENTRNILLKLKYNPSKISIGRVYLTRRGDLNRFANNIGSNNPAKSRLLHKLHGYGSG